MRSGQGWEHFAHGADVGLRGYGPTPAAAFGQAALALTAALCDPADVRQDGQVAVQCEAPDLDLLLVDWLDAIVYEMATRRMLFGAFDVEIAERPGVWHLAATLHGEPVDRARHEPAVEVKGATHTALRVAREPTGGWVAECVVDV